MIGIPAVKIPKNLLKRKEVFVVFAPFGFDIRKSERQNVVVYVTSYRPTYCLLRYLMQIKASDFTFYSYLRFTPCRRRN